MSMRRMVVLAYDDVQLLDVTGPIDVFDAANRLSGRPEYELLVASERGESVRTSSGVRLETVSVATVRAVHTLLVPGALNTPSGHDREWVTAGITRLARSAQRVASVCTGAFLLAGAGVLDQRRATTHWSACQKLADDYPAVDVEPDKVYVRDGNVWTAGGVAAGMDLALAMVADDLGDPIARAAAKWLLIFFQRPGGQSQFSARSKLPSVTAPQIRRAVDAVTAEPAHPWTVTNLAALVGIGPRHFARLFRTHTGTTPARFVETARLEAACSLLESTHADLEAVAHTTGFSSAETMRQTFQRHLHIAPSDYRLRFIDLAEP